mmetsp:Transcript_41457/g.119475  ORF Transcript_41457/g.119475 Transcript_41457/m.119475 type:complete len:209 (+) Transcript_41457:633-1259(+)
MSVLFDKFDRTLLDAWACNRSCKKVWNEPRLTLTQSTSKTAYTGLWSAMFLEGTSTWSCITTLYFKGRTSQLLYSIRSVHAGMRLKLKPGPGTANLYVGMKGGPSDWKGTGSRKAVPCGLQFAEDLLTGESPKATSGSFNIMVSWSWRCNCCHLLSFKQSNTCWWNAACVSKRSGLARRMFVSPIKNTARCAQIGYKHWSLSLNSTRL